MTLLTTDETSIEIIVEEDKLKVKLLGQLENLYTNLQRRRLHLLDGNDKKHHSNEHDCCTAIHRYHFPPKIIAIEIFKIGNINRKYRRFVHLLISPSVYIKSKHKSQKTRENEAKHVTKSYPGKNIRKLSLYL